VIPLHLNGNLFSVYAGGTLASDTFHWYKDNVLYQTITGDSTLTVTVTGNYSVQVTNKIITPATGLILYSDTLNSNGTIPITFVSFTGKAVNNTSLLQWQATNEVNTSYFIVQRSGDGIHFTDVGKVNAAGNSVSFNNYSYIDNTPAGGIVYYRLKETDADGVYAYSVIISIDFKNDGAALVYPNPARDLITIHLPSSPKASVLSFYDAQGKLVMKQRVESNTTVQQMDITKLAAGIYYVTVQQEKAVYVLKLLKQ
jgi:Secretion system C-terminal sorting domain